MNKKYSIKTFGCQMNYSDSERIAKILETYGFKPLAENGKAALSAEALARADLIVVNSCGVRQTAEDRIYSSIHNIREKNPRIKIILTGCLANREDVRKRLKNKVDLFVDIKDFQENFKKFVIANEVKQSNLKFRLPRPFGARNDNRDYLDIIPKYQNKFQAFVPVMTGCDNFCSYCVVPYARGREFSRPAVEIIREIKSLLKKGYREIILLGQNVNSYISPSHFKGEGWGGVINFSELLRKINGLPGHFWISFISNHPKDFSDELIKAAAQLPKVCEYIHLPLQAGDNLILRKMNRKYTRRKYLEIIAKIKKSFQKYKPGKLYSLTSDIIVGFPGETQKQFLQSAKVMKKVGFDMVYFGQYSPRPGTAAYQFKNNISLMEKSRREKYLNEILKKTSLANNQKYLGKTLEVLIDKKTSPFIKGETCLPAGRIKEGFVSSKIPLNPPFKKGEVIYFGRTRTMKNVKIISSRKNLIGRIIKVKIIQANTWNLEGKLSSRA
ncbi:MAG: hypothetical protein CO140_02455 [Candidatus Moranbacteria bacterium CG_4_9_14_3_um_filter_40_7]|nr:MAG: hypothetical protein COX31_00875 [Candidatus Moranbacteria bacterium CG23_combo_of_CG06-09_8_20_14_all_40_16]PIU80920.1 MAG: hypothetical protein COS71_00920 [Candidatus Moranbacteria bacterium CG06_land_8_20_14_3_00_40_12]PJA87778.1 MAG: hypothetical protein CO140_02455 [Candidatus Moranbacteria bacterium CG_4_9_14_3_um_filter_40_7]